MHLFVFGAGASQGSQSSRKTPRAPLVDELFAPTRERDYLECALQVRMSEQDFKDYQRQVEQVGSLEKWLTELWDDMQGQTNAAARKARATKLGQITLYVWWLMAQVSSTFGPDNLYKRLVEDLTDRSVNFGFVNFNYDLLLDRALNHVGYDLQTERSYQEARYLKPHGSVSWFLDKRSTDPPLQRTGIRDDMDMPLRHIASNIYEESQLPIDIRMAWPSSPALQHPLALRGGFLPASADYLYPLILVPMTTKIYPQLKPFVQQSIDQGKRMLSGARDIHLIGYRANDDLFREMLKGVEPDTTLHVVGLNGAQEVAHRVSSMQPSLRVGSLDDQGFRSYLEGGLLRRLTSNG